MNKCKHEWRQILSWGYNGSELEFYCIKCLTQKKVKRDE